MKERQSEMGKTPSNGGRNEVRVFENAQFGQIRTAQGASGEPLFCLADVCKALDLSNPSYVKKRLSKRGVFANYTPTYNQHGTLVMQEMNFIDEPNLYRCIFQSRKEEAELFQDWVCEEVLPAIRQSGGYVATTREDTPELIMARALQVAQSTIEKHKLQLQDAQSTIERQHKDLLLAQGEIKLKSFALNAAQKVINSQNEQLIEQTPKVKYTDNVLNSVNTYTSTQMAKELDLRTAEQLHGLLKGWGVMIRQSGQWLLAAKYCGQGYTKTRTHSYTRQDGTQGTNNITVWTERGRWFLHQLMEKKGGTL